MAATSIAPFRAHLPCGLIETQDDAAQQAKALTFLCSLGLAFGFIAENGRQAPTSIDAARRAGVIGLSGSLAPEKPRPRRPSPRAAELGACVAAGNLAGGHDLERPKWTEEPLHFAGGGVVISHRLHTMPEAGDCLIQVAEPLDT